MRWTLRIALLALMATVAFGLRRPSVAAGFSRPTQTRPVEAGRYRDVVRAAIIIPVEGIVASQLKPTFDQARTGHVHHALDILAPRGTPVLAATDADEPVSKTSMATSASRYPPRWCSPDVAAMTSVA